MLDGERGSCKLFPLQNRNEPMKTHISSSQVDTAVFNFPPSVPQIEVFVLGSYMPLTKTPPRMPRFLKEKKILR